MLTAVAAAVLGPLLYYRAPLYESAPDIFYVKAKVLQILQGGIFIDPVSGFASMHPPYYHLFLAAFKAIGIDLNILLITTTIFIVVATIYFGFKIIQTVFDDRTAMWTCILIPFIFEFMGPRFFLLATSFYFSIPFYLAGLWLYIKPENTNRLAIASAALWGLAFLISPVYVFLIGLTFLYEALIKKRIRRFAIMLVSFAVVIIPFLYQVIYIYSNDLWGSSAFALWRGFPDVIWFKGMFVEFWAPTKKTLWSIPAIAHLIILVVTGLVMYRVKRIHWFIPVSALAYVLTYYHFSGQYAMRIQLFLSVFIVATLINGLRQFRFNRLLWMIPIACVCLFSLYHHYNLTSSIYEKERTTKEGYLRIGENLWQNMDQYLIPGEYIFCTKSNYNQYIMAYASVHNLGAYRTMEYFQLNPQIADQLENDYNRALAAGDIAVIEEIAARYNIQTAIASGADMKKPLFKALSLHWNKVYQDKYFVIFKKPG